MCCAVMASAWCVVGLAPRVVRADPFVPIDVVPLGLVETFGILTPAAVGNAAGEPPTVIRGDVGAGGAVTGFPPGIITGTVYPAGAIGPMMTDLQEAFDDAAGRPAGTTLPALLGGLNIGPGVHTTGAATGTTAGTSFTIDGEGHADAVFILQVGGALSIGANTTITLINGAQAKNVFWQVVGAGGIGASTVFVGTLIAGTAVSSGAGSTVNGRLTSLTGAVTMGSTQLYSAPPSVSIDGGDAAYSTSSTPLIAGVTSARTPMTVTVSIDGVDRTPAVTPSSTGVWSFQSPLLINGDHAIVAFSIDGAGNVGSSSQLLTVDTTPPVVAIDGGPLASTNDVSPSLRGTTDVAANQTVALTLTRTAPPLTLTRTALVQADQTWSIAPNGFTIGEWTIVARVADPAGNQSSATQTLTIDATAPAAAITSSALTNDPTPTIAGLAEAGATIAVSIDGLAVTDLTQGTSWSATTTVVLGHGSHNVTATATDAVGNSTVLVQTLSVDLVLPLIAINPGVTDSASDLTPTIAGTTDVAVGVTVNVSIDGGTPLTALVQADGWNVTPWVNLSLGDHAVIATVADPAGNIGTGTKTITVTAPPSTQPPITQPPTTQPPITQPPITQPPITQPPITQPPIASPVDDFTSVGPKRVFDTRAGQSPNALRSVGKRQVSGGYELEVRMTDIAGFVPASGVGAVSLNVTSTESTAGGFITVYACGARELVSSLNFPGGTTVGNAVIAPVSNTGTVCFYANAPTDIIVDINGWFAAGAAFHAVGPQRVFDTRPGNSPGALRTVATTALAANTTIEVRLTDLAGYVPAAGVSAVSLNVVVTEPEAAGFITVYSCGSRALVSSVNYVAGHTVSNAVIAPVSANGTVCFYSLATTHLVVDINGWFEVGAGFTGVDPSRVLDTRPGESPAAMRAVTKAKIGGGHILEVEVTDLAGLVPAGGVRAVSLNVTVTNTEADGFVTVFPCGTMEEVSSLNYGAGSTVGNAVLAPVSATGTICLYSNQRTDVIVDINGWVGDAQAG